MPSYNGTRTGKVSKMPPQRTYNEHRVRVHLIKKIPPILLVDHVVDHDVNHLEETHMESHKKI